MLEIQLVRRSRNGVVIPIGRSDTPALVQQVAASILAELERMSFKDEVLDSMLEREKKAFLEILRAEAPHAE